MKSLICVLCILSAFASAKERQKNKTSEQEELILVNAYWRRGQTNLDSFNTNAAYLRLDPDGMADMFDLGLLLRNRYIKRLKFLDAAKAEESVYFQSIDDARALTEAQAVQAAMFPSSEKVYRDVEGWPSDWEPLAVHTLPEHEDYILYPEHNCISYYRAQARAVKRYVAQSGKEQKDTYNKLIEKTGLPDGTTTADLYRAIVEISQFEPYWAEHNDTVLKTLEAMAAKETKEYAESDEMIRLRAGPVLQEIVNRMRAKIDTLNVTVTVANKLTVAFIHNLRFYAYAQSSHPRSAVNEDFWQLSALSDEKFEYDQVVSAIVYELWRVGDRYVVSVLYCHKCDEKNDFRPIRIKGCPKATHCPLDTFEKVLAPYLGITTLKQRLVECGVITARPKEQPTTRASATVPPSAHRYKDDYSMLAIVFGIVVGVLAIVSINLCYMVINQKRQDRDGYVMVNERSSLLGK